MHNGAISLSNNPPTMVLPPSLLGGQPETSATGGSGSQSDERTITDVHCVVCQQSLFVKDMSPPRQQKPFKCNGCQQWFTVKSSAKRHVINVHKDRVCRDCNERGLGGEVASGKGTGGSGGGMSEMMHMHQQVVAEPSQPAFLSNRSASMIADPTEHQQKVYIQASQPTHIQIQPTAQNPVGATLTIHDTHDLQADLALLSLMLANNLDLKTMDAIIMLLNSGRDFSKIKNAAHWLERLGRGAAVNVATTCTTCKRPATQQCLNSGHQTHSTPIVAAHPVVKAVPQMQNSVANVPSMNPFPGGTVIGIFDASGQLVPTNTIPMTAASVVAASQAQQPAPQAQPPTKKAKSRKKRPPPPNAANGTPAPGPAVAPPTPHTGNKVGSLATSWKAVARNNLYTLHTPQELLGLCVVGRRVDKTVDTGLQPMDTEKRRIIAEAVANHCNSVGIPIPSETQINHFMSQILCDLRRKESLQATGQTPTRKKAKKEEPPATPSGTMAPHSDIKTEMNNLLP